MTTQVIPKQHGAWAALMASFAVGLAAGFGGGKGAWAPPALLLVALVSGFIARHAASAWIRRRRFLWPAIGSAAISLALVLALILRWNLKLFTPLLLAGAAAAIASIALERRQSGRTLFGELAGMLGLTFAAPAACYAASGRMDFRCALAWGACVLFFGASVPIVRLIVRKGAMPVKRVGYAALALTIMFTAMVATAFRIL